MTDVSNYSTPADAEWPDAAQLMLDGIHARIESERLESARKRGKFRGGSTGVVLLDSQGQFTDDVAAVCVRAAAARFLGAEPGPEGRDPADWAHKQLMFEAGYSNEDAWRDNLVLTWPGKVLREEEFPIKFEIDGIPGTGREDVILCDAAGNPQCLLELKAVCSLNTAVDVLLRARPKLEHAVQLGNYMLRTGLPGVLAYTNRFDIAVPDWGFLKPHLPRSPQDTNHHAAGYLQWSAGKPAGPRGGAAKAPAVTKIKQFVTRYKFRWLAGRLEWSTYESRRGEWMPTPITAAGIDEFYRRVTKMLAAGELVPPKAMTEIDGSAGHYDPCSYCDWNYLCKQVGDSYEQWHARVQRLADEAWEDAQAADAVVEVK